MNLFYTKNIKDGFAFLETEEARHCTQVLRKKVGDVITIVDGKGGWYTGAIVEASKKTCTIAIQNEQQAYNKRATHLHIAIAPTKNIARLEWFLEKATEIGIDEITPLLCARSERKKIRLDRLNKVLLTAMKQSLKAYLPKLNDWMTVKDFVQAKAAIPTQKFIAHCAYEDNTHLKELYLPPKNIIILIGPEGCLLYTSPSPRDS